MAEEEVGLRLSLKNRRETVAGLDDVGDKLDRAGDEAVALGRKSRMGAAGVVALGRAGRVTGRAMVYGFGAASAALVGTGIALTKLSKDSIAEAREAQKVGAITRQEIKATGAVANVSAKGVERLAGAISKKVGVDDEEIQSGANMILTFKNVRNEVGKGSKIFNRATRDAVDLAKAGFGSISSQSKVLAKALNDPTKGLTMLSRAGVTFTQDQQDRIKALVEEGDLLKAQKIILGEVESQVGGVAEAQATWGDKAKVSLGNIEESIGTALLPMLDRTEKWFVQKGAPVLEDWVGIFEKRGIPTIERYAGIFADKAVPAIGDFLDDARPLAESVIPAIGTGASTIADAFKVIAPRAKQVFDGFNNLPDWAKTGISLGVLGGVAAKKLGAFDLLGSRGGGGSGALGLLTSSRPVPVIVVNKGFDGVDPGWKKKVPWLAGAGATAGIAAVAGAGTFAGLKVTQNGMGQDAAHGAAGAGLGASHGGFGGSFVSSGLGDDPSNSLVNVFDDIVSKDYAKPFALGAKSANEFDDALQRIALYNGLDDANLAFMAFADNVGISRDALSKVTPEFAGMTARWTDTALSAGGRTKWLNQLIYGLGGTLESIDKDYRPKIYLDGIGTAEARLDSFQSKLSQLGAMDVSPGVGLSVLSAPRREHGGPVRAHRPYVVGERRPELFVPKVDGTILPRVPAMAGAAAAPPAPLHIHLELDGREIKEVVVDQLLTEAARK